MPPNAPDKTIEEAPAQITNAEAAIFAIPPVDPATVKFSTWTGGVAGVAIEAPEPGSQGQECRAVPLDGFVGETVVVNDLWLKAPDVNGNTTIRRWWPLTITQAPATVTIVPKAGLPSWPLV